MNSKQKIQYVKKQIEEKIQISPKGPVYVHFYTVTGEGGEDHVLLSRGEQKSIVEKLAEDGYLKSVSFGEKNAGAWVEKKVTATNLPDKRSNVFSRIKNTDQLIQNRELFKKVSEIIEAGNIRAGQHYKTSTLEENDDVIQLLSDLKLVSVDWKKVSSQKHRAMGNRFIDFEFAGDSFLPLFNRIRGIGGRVKKEAIEIK